MSEVSEPSSPIAAGRDRALAAARDVFARYGYRRTGMADIAAAAGLSRPALYQWFANKTALFRALAEMLHAEAIAAAHAAWPPGAPLEPGLEAAILAKDLPLFRLLHDSPHGVELLAVDQEVTAAIAGRLDADFAALLAAQARALESAGALDLAAFASSGGFGQAVARLAAALKNSARDEETYRADIGLLCRLLARATRPA